MSVSVDGKSLGSLDTAHLHLMPCTIEAEGQANVSQYFDPAIRIEEGDQEESGRQSSFRGRMLRGEDIQVPEGYKGIILKEPSKPFTEDEDRTLKAAHSFQSFTYWNLETATSSNDAIQRAMDWTQVASALHAPVPSQEHSSLESQGSVAGCR